MCCSAIAISSLKQSYRRNPEGKKVPSRRTKSVDYTRIAVIRPSDRALLPSQFSLLKSLHSIKLTHQPGYRGPILETNSRTITLAVSRLRAKRTIRDQRFDNDNSRLPLLIRASQIRLLSARRYRLT